MENLQFRRLAVVNRGEAAMRLLNAVPEFNAENDTDIRTIAFHTEPDRHAWFVREADEAWSLGAATFLDASDGRRKHTYLDLERLEVALIESKADAVWVGWGFVSEQAEFAALCEKLGLVFVGPPADVIRRLGDKIASKRLAEETGVDVVPWVGRPAADIDEARAQAAELGFPLFIKAAAGGGGLGIRRVSTPDGIEAAFDAATSEAARAFHDPTVFLERQLRAARHVEVQVVGDRAGTVWAVGTRDCSIQRRNQKVLEESASTALTSDEVQRVCDAAARLCRAAGYRNAGTVEFLYRPEEQAFYFMEVNARLQVEHPVTEITTGVDLVKLQLHMARGGLLEGQPPEPRGHAIEARLNAEDPERNFAPAPGRVSYFRAPSGPGIRVETGVAEGDDIAPEFDSMIAKVIAWGRDRGEARARLARSIRRCQVVIDGGMTNKSFLLGLLEHPDVVAGTYDTGWLDRLAVRDELLRHDDGDVALLQAAVEAYDLEGAAEQARFYNSAARGRPEVSPETVRNLSLRHRGQLYEVHVSRHGYNDYVVGVDGAVVPVRLERLGPYERRLNALGGQFRTVSVTHGSRHLVEVDGIAHTVSRDEGGVIRAPSPAIVVSIVVEVGDQIEVGDPLVVVESMKMESAITAPFAGRVQSVLVGEAIQVDAGSPLLQIELHANGEATPSGERLQFFTLPHADDARSPEQRCKALYQLLHAQMLGYDAEPADLTRVLGELDQLSSELPVDHPDILAEELRLLGLFADVCALSRRQPDADTQDGGVARSAQDHLTSYLRSPDRAAAGLPAGFRDRLSSALSHYDIDSLDRTPALEESLLWMYKSYLRLPNNVQLIVAILDRRLEHADALGSVADDAFRVLLDRLISSTENRFDAVADLAREVRYVVLDKPVIDQARRDVYSSMVHCLDLLAVTADDVERDELMAKLVECPQPLAGMLMEHFGQAEAVEHHVLLEVLIRRFYRIRELEDLARVEVGGHPAITASYEYEGQRVCLVSVYGAVSVFSALADGVARFLQGVPSSEHPVVEFYLRHDGPLADPDTNERTVAARLAGIDFGRWIRRVDIALFGEPTEPGRRSTQYFTYRQGDNGFFEEKRFRNLHPMLGKRHDLWRLCNFDVERLPSAEDVYLFRGVAHANPDDERLFAFAEVRDLTPVLSADGTIEALPELERMVMESLSALRHFQSHQTVRQRLFWNQVVLLVRPTWVVPPEAWSRLARRLTPATRSLGLEKTVLRTRMPDDTGVLIATDLEVTASDRGGFTVRRTEPADEPIEPLTPYQLTVAKMQRRGAVYPYELINMIAPPTDTASSLSSGRFEEYDLDDQMQLCMVQRPYGQNTANLVVGLVTNKTDKHPEGMQRVAILGDPSRSLGSLAEPECRRIVAALDLADEMKIPVEWFAVSSGAKISMTSGTENMDWIATVLRRLIEFTQDGGEVNVIVTGVNVGAQPYWNAEATMLMHTRGILVMTPDSAMVLTGKQALDFSGGVSAEDNLGIGGFDRVMGPNGQAQYFASDIAGACDVLFRHYDLTYVAPGERFPRRAATSDPVDRDVRRFPHPSLDGSDFTTVGDIFSDTANPERKKPFDIRSVMRAVADQDSEPLERWQNMLHSETSVVWNAHIGGIPTCLIGFESNGVARRGFIPADGPVAWTSGTLFPMSSKKTARAITSASGRTPLVVLANLSGFDGSPESMRLLQLEFGAEIGRAVTNFRGPMVFCVVARYDGGAFVVFSKALNDNLEIAAIEGSRASVIGGAPAAAVVFADDVDQRTDADPRITDLLARIDHAEAANGKQLRVELDRTRAAVRAAKLTEVADEFDSIHSIERAQQMGSVDRIIAGSDLRPYIVEALERGMARDHDHDRDHRTRHPGAGRA